MKTAFKIAGKIALYLISTAFFLAAGVDFYVGEYASAFAFIACAVLFLPFVAKEVFTWAFNETRRKETPVARALPAIAEPAPVRNAPKPKPEPKKKPRTRAKTTKTKRK